MTTIITKNSSTSNSVPTAAQLVQGELAVNVTDKRLFTENSSGTVVELGTNPSSLALPNGSVNGVPYLNASKVLTTGSALTFDGTNLVVGGYVRLGQNSFLQSSDGSGGWVELIKADSSNNTVINNNKNLPILFNLNSSEQMRLNSTGLGIGTSSPGVKLHVYNASGAGALIMENGSNGGVYARWKRPNREYYLALDINNNGGNDFSLYDATAAATRWTVDSSGNLGLGVTPSGWSVGKAYEMRNSGNGLFTNGAGEMLVTANAYYNGGWLYGTSNVRAARYVCGNTNGTHLWYVSTDASQTAGAAISFTQAMTLDASGNFLVGTTGQIQGTARAVFDTTGLGIVSRTSAGSSQACLSAWNSATTGNNQFIWFYTDGGPSFRGSIEYNRLGGLVAYNTTSDYRSKDIIGPVVNPGAIIDALTIYTGKMKGATIERPMMIAHEAQAVTPYAVTGEKDAVNEDGTPKYQQMDHASLVPLLIAELQSLRKRLAALEAK